MRSENCGSLSFCIVFGSEAASTVHSSSRLGWLVPPLIPFRFNPKYPLFSNGL